MIYVKVINGEASVFPYDLRKLRADNPNTSFPKEISTEMLEEYGVFAVVENRPECDPYVQTLSAGTPVLRNGQWQVDYTALNLPEEDAKEVVRNARFEMLYATDWMALSDVVMSADMVVYRQALRDIPQQEGFPFSVVWPTKPEV